jgi:hypothetical protein
MGRKVINIKTKTKTYHNGDEISWIRAHTHRPLNIKIQIFSIVLNYLSKFMEIIEILNDLLNILKKSDILFRI